MKVLAVVAGGIADKPLMELGGETPLGTAKLPTLGRLVANGISGLWEPDLPVLSGNSDSALHSFLGISDRLGGGAIEAVGIGLDLQEEEVAFRSQFVCLRPGATNVVMFDAMGYGLSDEEGEDLSAYLRERLATDEDEEIRLHPIRGPRAVLTYRKEKASVPEEALTGFTPPHAALGESISDHMPAAGAARRFVHLVNDSQMILSQHPGLKRKQETAMFAANSLWLWDGGRRGQIAPLSEALGGRSVAFISASPAVNGMARLGGGKAMLSDRFRSFPDGAQLREAARSALQTHDFVLIHTEDAAEASLQGDAQAKIAALEALDADLLGPLVADPGTDAPCRILLMSDYIASTEERRPVAGPVPFAMADWRAGRLSPPPPPRGLAGLWQRISGHTAPPRNTSPRTFSERLGESSPPLTGKALLRRLFAA